MLTLLSIICFVLAAFGVDLPVDLIAVGLALFAAGHLFDGQLPSITRRA